MIQTQTKPAPILYGAEVKTMNSREIAQLVESRHDSVKRTIERCSEKGVFALPPTVETSFTGIDGKNQTASVYQLCKRDSLIVVAQLCPEFTARIIDRWQELESKQAAFNPTTLSRIDILKLAMDAEEGRIKAEAERDHAIATKAQIGSKREATAMATASKAAKEVARLKDKLGFSVRQATILQVEDATGQYFDFLPLRRWCTANEVVAESVPDRRYPKGVKAWPAAAWAACYGVDLSSLFGG